MKFRIAQHIPLQKTDSNVYAIANALPFYVARLCYQEDKPNQGYKNHTLAKSDEKIDSEVFNRPAMVQEYFSPDKPTQKKLELEKFYHPGKDLSAYINKKNKFSVATQWSILYQLLCQLQLMHKHDYVHLDIKPSNIIYDDVIDTAQLIDTNISAPLNQQIENLIGTPNYMHPAILHLALSNAYWKFQKISLKTAPFIDYWSLGITYLELIGCLTKTSPYYVEPKEEYAELHEFALQLMGTTWDNFKAIKPILQDLIDPIFDKKKKFQKTNLNEAEKFIQQLAQPDEKKLIELIGIAKQQAEQGPTPILYTKLNLQPPPRRPQYMYN